MSTPPAKPEIEFWFELASNYSYLSVMRIEEEAVRRGVTVVWKPFLLGPIFKDLGWNTSPFVIQAEKGRYMWRDMIRQCEKYGIPWKQPTTFPRSAVLPARVALWGAQRTWIGEFCRRVMLQSFAEDREVSSEGVVSGVLADMGLPAGEVLAAAQSDSNKLALRAQTDEARRRGIFGAPTFFVRDEMFWGNDRLDEALLWACHGE